MIRIESVRISVPSGSKELGKVVRFLHDPECTPLNDCEEPDKK
jgi:hypothetical protein